MASALITSLLIFLRPLQYLPSLPNLPSVTPSTGDYVGDIQFET